MITDMTPYAGKHGTLVVGESTLVGTVIDVSASGRFTFHVDGSEWVDLVMPFGAVDAFTPSAPPLPTEPGVYVPVIANIDHGPVVFVLYGSFWRVSPHRPGADAETEARYWNEHGGLVRLVPEDSL